MSIPISNMDAVRNEVKIRPKIKTGDGDKTSKSNSSSSNKLDEDGNVRLIKTPTELQRLKLEKLMNNPAKEVYIPDRSKDKAPRGPLEFIRNIWGSSAGAGSGDFHVYRGVRRREYARQKYMNEKTEKDALDEAYQKKLDQNKTQAEERTAKKRAKRQKQKERLKAKKMKKGSNKKNESSETKSSSSSEQSEEEEEDKEAQSSH